MRIWLLDSLPAEPCCFNKQVLIQPQVLRRVPRGAAWPREQVGSRELLLFFCSIMQSYSRQKWVNIENLKHAILLHPYLLRFFFFYLWAKDAQRQLLFVTLFILVLNNAAKSVSRTATRKKPQLFRCDIHKLLSAVAGELLEMGTSSKALRSPWWKEHHLLGWSPNSQWELLWCTGAASALQMLCIQTYILGRSAKEFCNSWLDQDVTNSKLQFSLKQPV